MKLKQDNSNFKLFYKGREFLSHSHIEPMIYLGLGEENIKMHEGNFDIEDKIIERIALRDVNIIEYEDSIELKFSSDRNKAEFNIKIEEKDGKLYISGCSLNPYFNRVWFKLSAKPDEHIYGLGEQYSYFDLRGKNYPIFTREQGVGRNKNTLVTFLSDSLNGGAGGDYHTTYFPQASFISSALYYVLAHGYHYKEIDLSNANYHEIHIWGDELNISIALDSSFDKLLYSLGNQIGRQPMLPKWAFEGLWLGMQGGSDICNYKLDTMLNAGAKVSAVWIQDWVGRKDTSFGQRLYWNWQWNKKLYPTLDEDIRLANEKNVHYLSYINPHLIKDSPLFNEAEENGFFVKNREGNTYLLDFGEFLGGFVDFTNPAACEWYQNVIKENMLNLGFRGWMADFGEYLPTDCVLYSGIDPIIAHNKWPTLWAKQNYEACKDAGLLGEVAYFTRSGATKTQGFSPMMFAGDQCVDFSLDDGIASVVNAALSLAMSGFGMFTFDIGGYTGLEHMKRSKELLLRGCEFACFSPVMRTHEGNRPKNNHQFDSDSETIEFFVRFSRIHELLSDYIYELAKINSSTSTPTMRPLFFHYPDEEKAYTAMYQYMLGEDILVAPIVLENAVERQLYLPKGKWIHIWSEVKYLGGSEITIEAPLGSPPVFIKAGSETEELIPEILAIK